MANGRMQLNSLKILIIPGLIPFPPIDGGRLCVYGFIDYLRRYHKFHILLFANNDDERNDIEALKLHWPDVSITGVCLYQSPPPMSVKQRLLSTAKRTIRRSIEFFRSKPLLVKENPSQWYLAYLTTSFYLQDYLLIDALDKIFSKNSFDIIQTELTLMLNLVSIFPVTAKKVFVQIENRSDVLYDYGIANKIYKGYLDHVVRNTEFLEYAYMSQYDAVFALNESDKMKIQQKLPGVKVYNSPYGILEKDIKRYPDGKRVFENLIFMGGENHYPNVDALEWFLSDVIRHLSAKQFKKLYVTGHWTKKTVAKLKQLNNCVEFIGFVDDLSVYLQNSISIVPIRIGGGGIRTKILTAMAQGSPIVATSLSSIGIGEGNRDELLVADTDVEFAAAISLLLENKGIVEKIVQKAYDLIDRQFSQKVVSEKRNIYYLELVNSN
ncbi:MAG: glycosyltransferase family 4 protein [Chitinophagales bacterium]